MKNNMFISCVLIVGSFLGGGLIVSYKLYNKIRRVENSFLEYRDGSNVASLYQAFAMAGRTKLDKEPHNVLCLGNSITKHEVKESIGWKSDWGMAASREDKDYCHQLQNLMKTYNLHSTVIPLNIANWEMDLSIDIDSLLSKHIEGKDIVIIRLGENVRNIDLFKTAIIKLVRYCQSKVAHTYITGCFWKDDDKEAAIINAANECHIKYIPLYWLSHLYKETVYPKEGDTLTDTQGRNYKIKDKFIITHPNDEGMRRIADTIFENL